MQDKKPQKPNGLLYHFVYGIAYLFFKLVYRFKVDRTDAPDSSEPFVLLVNHISNLDFLLPMLGMYPHKLNLVATMQMFRMKPLQSFFSFWWLGFIPKEQFVSDPKSIRHIFYMAKKGGNSRDIPVRTEFLYGRIHADRPEYHQTAQKAEIAGLQPAHQRYALSRCRNGTCLFREHARGAGR